MTQNRKQTYSSCFKRALTLLLQLTLPVSSIRPLAVCALARFLKRGESPKCSFRPTLLLFMPSFIHECAESSPFSSLSSPLLRAPAPSPPPSLSPALPAAAILECWMRWRRGGRNRRRDRRRRETLGKAKQRARVGKSYCYLSEHTHTHTTELTDCLPTCEPLPYPVKLLPDALLGQVNNVSIVSFVFLLPLFYFGEGGLFHIRKGQKVVG